jgi:hypothetical protein
MRGAIAVFVLLIGIVWCADAHAQVYQCTAADGNVSFQDRACAQGQKQKLVNLPGRAPPGYVPPAPASSPQPASTPRPLPAPTYIPPPPVPAMYACVGAVNGKHYLTRHPPPPYLAPLGVMGYPPQTLSQAYGAPGGAGMSAPEGAAKPRVGGPPIAAGMTEVQDACAPASHAEVCGFVQHEYDENDRKLRMAMPREQPPFERCERELLDQLRNCR